jgi:hypothetical protein
VPERVVEIKEVGRLGKSDHVMIKASIDISRKEVKTREMVLNWSRVDWESIRTKLRAINWERMLNGGTVNDAWTCFRNTVAELVEMHVPVRPRRAPNKPV